MGGQILWTLPLEAAHWRDAARRAGLVLVYRQKVVVVGKRSSNGFFINDWFSRQYRLILQKRQDNYLFLILFRTRNGPEICL